MTVEKPATLRAITEGRNERCIVSLIAVCRL